MNIRPEGMVKEILIDRRAVQLKNSVMEVRYNGVKV